LGRLLTRLNDMTFKHLLLLRSATDAMISPPCRPLAASPWTIEEMNAACFIVRDKNGQG
jgi:hypothetical protein